MDIIYSHLSLGLCRDFLIDRTSGEPSVRMGKELDQTDYVEYSKHGKLHLSVLHSWLIESMLHDYFSAFVLSLLYGISSFAYAKNICILTSILTDFVVWKESC